MGAGLEQVMRVKQVHGASRARAEDRVRPCAADVAETPEADAIVSNAPGLRACRCRSPTACRFCMADRKTARSAAVHAGWRGTCAGVARAAVDAMTREFGADPGDLHRRHRPEHRRLLLRSGTERARRVSRWPARTREDIARWFTHTDHGLAAAGSVGRQSRSARGRRPARRITSICRPVHADAPRRLRVVSRRRRASGSHGGADRVPN